MFDLAAEDETGSVAESGSGGWACRWYERAKASRLRRILDSIPQMVWTNEPDGRQSYYNKQWYSFTGLPREDARSVRRSELLHPADRDRALEAWRSSLASGEPYEAEFRLRHHSGQYRRVLSRGWPQRDPFGRIVRWYGSTTDIDGRRLEQEDADADALPGAAAEISEARLRNILDSIPQMVWTNEADGRQSYYNKQWFAYTGLEPGPAERVSRRELVHPDDLERVMAAWDRSIATGEPYEAEYRLRHHSGEYRWILSRGVPERDGSGKVVGWYGTATDIDEHRKVREALLVKEAELQKAKKAAEEAAAAKASFLANMSHEIRTPLNSIIGFTDLLLDDESLDAAHKRQMQLIQNSGNALLSVVNDILDLSKLEAGKIEFHEEPFSIQAFVDHTTSIVQRTAEAKGLEVRIEVDPSLSPYHLGDEARLRQVLLNLLNNAVKFTSAGFVSVEARRLGRPEGRERIHFAVADSGPGIPEAKQGLLFKQFSQTDASISREYGGTGLGLAICKNLVEMMGGRIGVSSKPGVGSTFWFEVELAPANAPADPGPVLPAGGEARTGTILLVDDLPINQELACAILKRSGHEVDVASNGAEAVHAVQGRKYDLVLMDIQMPVVDGVTATRMIRGLPGPASRVPIVAMTANVLPEQVREFRAAGMDGHVAKPIKQAELHRAVQQVLGAEPESGEGQ
ncbi:MAG TPA: PAS domain-containing protein, partial [Allosphingosinicella sp.]|nr:PAS domain-containing protein [Allosphingosinicella sp.]